MNASTPKSLSGPHLGRGRTTDRPRNAGRSLARLWSRDPWRLTALYGAWGLALWPLWARILQMADRQELYFSCLLAPLLSWHASLAHYRRIVPERGAVHPWLLVPAIVAMTIAAATTWLPPAGACAGLAALLLLRMAVGGESFRQMLSRGGAVLLFMVPLTPEAVTWVTTGLRRLHAGLAAQLLGSLTSVVPTADGFTLVTEFGTGLVITPECSGVYSLAVLVLFGLYYATTEGHPACGFLFTGAAAAVLAFALNVGRVLLSCLQGLAGESFWASPAGHELLGLILAVLGVILIRALARDVLVREQMAGAEPAPASTGRPSGPSDGKEAACSPT